MLPPAAFNYPASGTTANYPFSFSVWFKTATSGVILGQQPGAVNTGLNSWVPALYIGTDGKLYASVFNPSTNARMVTAARYNDDNWHHAVSSYNAGVESLYVDGVLAGQQTVNQIGGTGFFYQLGTGVTSSYAAAPSGWNYFNGHLDEVRIAATPRSAEWIATEYNNLAPSGNFLYLLPENAPVVVTPPTAPLYANQTQQFAAAASSCAAGTVLWTATPSGFGTLSPTGFYTAPVTITAPQAVTITAASTADNTVAGTATIMLYPPVTVGITPATATLAMGQTQQFLASVGNAADLRVTWSIFPALGTINTAGQYTAPSFLSGQTQVRITATSVVDPTKSATVTILVGPLAAAPAFTQTFGSLLFNASAIALSPVSDTTRPFTNVAVTRTGVYAGTVVAQDVNGYQAGVGPLFHFNAVFTGTLNVPSAGQRTFTITSSDGFVLGIQGATRVSGPLANAPAQTTFRTLPVMGATNIRQAPAAQTIVVNFPAAGTYPYELDYSKGGDSKLTLTMFGDGAAIPAATFLSLTPQRVPSATGGTISQLTLKRDGSWRHRASQSAGYGAGHRAERAAARHNDGRHWRRHNHLRWFALASW